MSFPPRMTQRYAADLSQRLERPARDAYGQPSRPPSDADGGAAPPEGQAARVTFTVLGKAAPAGSKRGFVRGGKVVITDASKGSKPWQALVRSAAADAYTGPLLEGPLALSIREQRVRPTSHLGKRGLSAKGRGTPFPSTRPDLLKIARGIEDALSGLVYRDDAQIVVETLEKVWAEREQTTVTVWEVSP